MFLSKKGLNLRTKVVRMESVNKSEDMPVEVKQELKEEIKSEPIKKAKRQNKNNEIEIEG